MLGGFQDHMQADVENVHSERCRREEMGETRVGEPDDMERVLLVPRGPSTTSRSWLARKAFLHGGNAA